MAEDKQDYSSNTGEYWNPDLMQRVNKIEHQLEGFPNFKQSTEQMLYWWRGNGSPGARELMARFVTEEYVDKIIESTVKRVLEAEYAKRGDRRIRVVDIIIAGGIFVLMLIELAATLPA